jgi:N,N'-diacetyllegionaminate synthase
LKNLKNSNKLNDPSHVYVIAEAGSNWKIGSYEEDLNQAKKLIEIAKNSGADAVKFQTYRSNTIYVPNAGSADYLKNEKTINEVFDDCSMPYEMLHELSKYSQKKGICFMSTAFSVNDASQIDPYVSIHKVASYEINHIRLLEFLAKTRKPIIISTGASTIEEIDFALEIIQKEHNNIALLQCTASYPADIESLNLSVIPNLKEKYNLPVGLSDHSIDPVLAPLIAVGLGATIIEKHFTSDKTLPGPDHYFALNPDGLSSMIKTIRHAEIAKGNGIKEILVAETELSNFAKRSIQATCDICKNDILQEGKNFDVLRSGKQKQGLSPRFLDEIDGKKSNREIKIGEGITLDDIS